MTAFADLASQLTSYMAEDQLEEVKAAYSLAEQAHEGQWRSSGEPYIVHPVAVASILADMKMDAQCIIAALLHDVLEDTDVDKEQLTIKFNEKVADLVDGVSKLTKIPFASKIEAQASNLRKMMLAMSKDIRVILIKLADRLHNMRTLKYCGAAKQRRIAIETLEIYAPIANRLGINHLKLEFEDLGFFYLYPFRYTVLQNELKKRSQSSIVMNTIKHSLENKLGHNADSVIDMFGRKKHVYSIYRKMRYKHLSFHEVLDIYALRIIVTHQADCYHILGLLHSLYKPIHGRIKDYIAVPKFNGYQSLHTTIIGPNHTPIEVQIRTQDMDYVAENGICAHWLYKIGDQTQNPEIDFKTKAWVQDILTIQQNTETASEFLENIKVELYPDEVYIFSTAGDIYSLPQHATPVDFAYAFDIQLGHTCVASKIDGCLAPLSTKLASGQTVEILSTNNGHPNPAWLNFVVTSKARISIKYWLQQCQHHESAELGEKLLRRALQVIGVSEITLTAPRQTALLQNLGLNSMTELYSEIGLGNQIAPVIARRLNSPNSDTPYKISELASLPIKGTEGMVIHYATCCHPIPGDVIVGCIEQGAGILVHNEHCKKIKDRHPNSEKYFFVQWDQDVQGDFTVPLIIEVFNERGLLASLAHDIAVLNANIENVHIEQEEPRYNTIKFIISVKNLAHLNKIMNRLQANSLVHKITRPIS